MTDTTITATTTEGATERRSAAPRERQRLKLVPLEALSVSPLNVRKHGPREIASLAASIRAQGLLQPLIARCSGDGFEVIAGSRRLKALQRLAAEDGSGEPVPVIVLRAGDDASAIAASLAENIERLPMDELDQYAAFAALIRQGRSEDDIAEAFGITPLTVRRRLALARLIPDVQRLYRAGEIESDTLKLLTLASRERQKAFAAALRDPDGTPLPARWQLKAWLLGGAEIDTRHALFGETQYTGDIAGDLFGERRYFTDAEQFWRLQNGAIAALKDDLAAKGWSQVVIIGPDAAFYPHQWQAARKDDGAAVVIAVAPSGSIEVHKGLISVAEAGKRRAAALKTRQPVRAGQSGETGQPGEGSDRNEEESVAGRPEMSAPLANYCDLIRLAAVRAELIANPKTALRLLVAHLMGRASNLRAVAEPASSKTDAAREAFLAHPATAAMEEARKTALAALKLDPEASVIQKPFAPDRTAQVFDALLGLDDKAVLGIAALVMAETLAAGSTIVDAAGTMLEVNALNGWAPDQALLDLVRDRETSGALLEEVIGAKAAASYLTDTAKRKKEIIANALAGKGRPRVEGWCPRWMAFPQGQYTGRPRTSHTPPTA